MKKINWSQINEAFGNIDWNREIENMNYETSAIRFYERILDISKQNVLKKKKKHSERPPRERRILFRKKNKLTKRKRSAHCKEQVDQLNNQISEIEEQLIASLQRDRRNEEKRLIDNIETSGNTKLFFSYAKKFKNVKSDIGPFKKGESYINDTEEMCNMLLEQYNSVFSTNEPDRIDNEMFNIPDSDALTNITVKKEDIKEAIDKLDPNSAAGPDGIPAILLKKMRDVIAEPLAMLLRKSIDENMIIDLHKLQHIAPIFKGGSRLYPKNYRPVSLTSHIMKVFERVIVKNIINHLQSQNRLNPGQHGFVPNRSTQTQLLVHYETIYQTLFNNQRLDVVYLDFAKAFDKVSHKIVLEKLVKHKIGGLIGKWIKEFLTNRKQVVVVKGCKSNESEVLSGVPQGTVLAAILFVIMIHDINEDAREVIVRSFADDTRVSKEIISERDKEILQRALIKIYSWADKNKMQFNSEKFEQISHGKLDTVSEGNYKGPDGNVIQYKDLVKDLGIIISRENDFSEHINKVVVSCKVMSGYICRSLMTRDRKAMLLLMKAYIRSKVEYCNVVYAPYKKQDIAKIESIQRSFTAKIEGLENLDYWDRLKELGLYSLERRRERYLIIYAWQQLEGQAENILNLESESENSRTGRKIKICSIPTTIPDRNRSLIFNSPKQTMGRLFNCLPVKLRKVTNVKKDSFKKALDSLLKIIPDTPLLEEDKYISRSTTHSNSILHQINTQIIQEYNTKTHNTRVGAAHQPRE